MASPFRFFRKHTKVFLAVAAVLAIFIFVVGDAIGRGSFGGGDNGVDQVVATWDGGKLTAGQLNSLMAQRRITDEFLKAVFVQGGGSTGYDFPANVPQFFLNEPQLDQLDTEVIGIEVIADLAEKSGMTVSDSLINHYIQELGLKNVDGQTVERILDNIGQGNARANESIVFNTLRKLLLAHFYRRTFADASMVVLPQERWNDWRKVNERISIEAAALPVEKFIDQVPEPTEDQLLAFYNDYKDFDPGRFQQQRGRELPVAEPGFAEPRRVRLQYLMGSVAGRTEKLLDQVTEEEIKDYYERNKRTEFIKMSLPGADAFDAPATDAPETPATPSVEGREDASSADKPAAGETPSAPAEESASETEAAPAEAAPPVEDANESSSEARQPSPFRLASFQEEPAATDQAAETVEEPAATEGESETEPTEPAATGEAAQEAPAPEASADAAAPATTPATDNVPGGASGGVIDPAAALPADEDVEYEPLENVRDEIRRRIATDKAVEELERTMSEAAAQLQAEYNQYGSQVAAAQESEKPAPKPPAKLTDLKWLADQYGLTYEKTTPLTVRELFDTAVGKARDAATQATTVMEAAYQTLQLYEPFLALDLGGDYYLVAKIEDTARRIPEFKEVRDEVAKAWKRAEAAKLAEKEAEKLAAEVTKSGAPFDQFFFAERGFDVIKPTAFFSWRSYPVGQAGTGTPPVLSDVPELKNVGQEFMQTAFGLDGKEAAAVMNTDRSIAYVIRLDRKQYPDDELRRLFLEEEGSWGGRIDMLNEHYYLFNNAVEREILEERAGLEFNEEWLAQRQERLAQRQN
ncbi:MAG TPA: hypothetical protein VF175_02265 [Lacipirellula sp.]